MTILVGRKAPSFTAPAVLGDGTIAEDFDFARFTEGKYGVLFFYPLVADLTHEICRAYGVETPAGDVALRGSFLIDVSGVVRHQVVNDLPLGRDIDEMLRMVDALQFHESHGEVCPAGWRKGRSGMRDTGEGVAGYLAEHAETL